MATLRRGAKAPVAGPRIATESLRAVAAVADGVSGGFVFIEPAPTRFVGIATMVLFAVTGLSLRRGAGAARSYC